MSDASSTFLIHAESGQKLQVTGDKGDITFPEQVRGWSDVLDCRHEPFTEKPVQELRHYAQHIHKDYLLIGHNHISFRFGART